MTDLGTFTVAGWPARHGENVVLDLPVAFLHGGLPQRSLMATVSPDCPNSETIKAPVGLDLNHALLRLLAHPNIASKAAVIRLYDHEVQGGTAVKPLIGARDDGPSDACAPKPAGTRGARGVALSVGINAALRRA